MEPFRLHVYACSQQKPEGAPSCTARGSLAVIEALRQEIGRQGLAGEVQVTTCGSLGLCQWGPNLVVYPEGTWYTGVQVEDVPELVREHLAQGRPVERLLRRDAAALKAEMASNREKMLAAQRARDAAGLLPNDLQATIRGFQASRAILSAIELDLFTAVGTGATALEVAATAGTAPRATAMLLDALAALELLVKRGEAYENTPTTARFLVAGSPDDARASLLHTAHLWGRWSTLTQCVRAGTSVTWSEMTDRGDEWTEAFIAAMHRNSRRQAPLVVGALGLDGVRRALDVGGGSGAYAIALAQAKADLLVEVFDLPTVLPITRRHVEAAGLADRVTTRPGDMRTDALGEGYDLILLSAVCHMFGPEGNRDLFARCAAALAPGGRLVVQDFILDETRTAPRHGALFALNMLVGTQAGSSYTLGEYRAWMEAVGLGTVSHVPLAGPSGLVVGRKD